MTLGSLAVGVGWPRASSSWSIWPSWCWPSRPPYTRSIPLLLEYLGRDLEGGPRQPARACRRDETLIRKTLILLWMLFPVGVAGYHFNYGPKQMARRQAHVSCCRKYAGWSSRSSPSGQNHRAIQPAHRGPAGRRRPPGALPNPAGGEQGPAGNARSGRRPLTS